MTRSSSPVSEIGITLFLALTGQSLLLIPHWQVFLTEGLSSLVIIGAGMTSWLVSRWLQTAILADYRKNISRYVRYTAVALTILFALLYANAGLIVESLILIWLAATTLLEQNIVMQTAHFWAKLTIALVNLGLGVSLIVVPALFLRTAYRPILEWQTEFGILFFLTGLYALPVLLRKQTSLSSSAPYLLVMPWIGYLLAFLHARNVSSIIPSLTLILCLTFATHVPWDKITTPVFNGPIRRALQALHLAETILLFILTGLVRLAKTNAQGFGFEEAAFIFALALTVITSATAFRLSLILSRIGIDLGSSETQEVGENTARASTRSRFSFILPFTKYQQRLFGRLQSLEQKIQALEEQLAKEKRKIAHLTLLNELNKQLESPLDPPVAAQLVANTIERALNCALVAVLLYEEDRRQFHIMATAGLYTKAISPSYYQSIKNEAPGRIARQRKTQVIPDSRLEPERMCLSDQHFLSEISVPLVHHGHLQGILVVDGKGVAAFDPLDIETVEAAAEELTRAWERFNDNQRLTNLIQVGITLSTLFEPQTAIEEIARVSRQSLAARFTFVTLVDQDGKSNRIAHAGNAAVLLERLTLAPSQNPFMQVALTAHQPFRIRDVRKSKYAAYFSLNDPSLRSLLVIPIHLHRLNIGAILAFGKQDGLFFTENDEDLARLLSSQVAATIESAWLYQELRTALGTATLLYQLSSNVIQAEQMEDAAKTVAETAFQLSNATQVGIVLFSAENKVTVQLTVDVYGTHSSTKHPSALIEQACKGGQSVFVSPGPPSKICYPLRTPLRNYGALWLEIPENLQVTPRYTSNLQALANQAAVALERAILLAESRQQAKALENAYRALESTYDQTLAALTSALDARDRETKGHSLRVAKIASLLGKAMGLSEPQIKALERGALLHDIGKIGIQDTILHKPGPLNEAEWRIMRMHPEIGARIVEGIPFLEESLPVIRYHQERWDGSGYPVGLCKTDIPTLARIFAVADAFDALTSTRPYRRKSSIQDALVYLQQQAGILFDPQIVDLLGMLIEEGKIKELIKS